MSTASISRFTPSTMPEDLLERLFVVRQPILKRLMDRVANLGTTPSPHHTLLVGPRGAGKTHIISLVYHRSKKLIAQGSGFQIAWLPEDPWTIMSYRHLLSEILRAINPDQRPQSRDEAELDAQLRAVIKENGPILILAENFDQILDALGEQGQQKLRHLLQTGSNILIIGSTTRLDRNLSDHSHPFFGFFDTIRLTPFSPEEARKMLVALAIEGKDDRLKNKLSDDATLSRICTIAHLAGGQPRLWALLGSALTVEQLDHLAELLLSRFDDLTPYYQEQLARLSPQQRLVVAELASADRPLAVKELAGRIGADQRSVAKTVGDLTDRGWLEPISTIFADLLDRRRTYYELAEPLARLAFQIKESRGEPLPLVIDFLINWFDADQLRASDKSAYGQAALMEMEQDEVGGLVRQLTSLPDSRAPSLDLLGQVEDALAAISDGDAEPIMSLQSTLRQAIEHRAGPSLNIAPIRLELLESALEEVGDVPRRQSSAEWVARAERLDREVHSSGSRLMLVRWLAASWRLDEAEAALDTIILEEDKLMGANTVARAYLSTGLLHQAIILFEQTLADSERILGPDHPDTLTSRGNLARAYLYAGGLEQAINLFKQTLADGERILGPDHPDTLTSRGNLARAYLYAGGLEQAINLFKQTLADGERILGPDHPDTLTSRNNLASAYQNSGRLEQAIPLFEQNLADRERILGPDHPDTLTSRNNLASAYQNSGRLEQAIPLFEQNLADRERILGPDHPGTLISRNNLASAYQNSGRLEQAIPLFEQNLADRERILGPDHPDTLTSRNNLASTYRFAGRLEQAINLFEQNLTDSERILGPNHPDTLTSRNNLARAYQDADRLEQAIDLFEQNLTDSERILGPNHPDTLTSRNNLARAYQDADRLEQAIDLFEQNLTDSEHVLGPNHPWTTLFRDNLARAREARN